MVTRPGLQNCGLSPNRHSKHHKHLAMRPPGQTLEIPKPGTPSPKALPVRLRGSKRARLLSDNAQLECACTGGSAKFHQPLAPPKKELLAEGKPSFNDCLNKKLTA